MEVDQTGGEAEGPVIIYVRVITENILSKDWGGDVLMQW